MKILVMTLTLLLTGCSAMKKAIKEAQVNTQMAQRVANYKYQMPISKLKEEVLANLQSDSDSGWQFTTQDHHNFEQQEEVKEALEQGFIYKDKMYVPKGLDLGLADIGSSLDDLKDKIVKSTTERDFHIIEDNENIFMIVDEDTVYRGTRVSENESKLQVKVIKHIVRDNDRISLDFVGIAKGLIGKKGNLFSIEQGPISFEKSFESSTVDYSQGLTMFKKIRPDEAQQMASEISQQL